MSMEDAKAAFLRICSDFGVVPEVMERGAVTFTLPFSCGDPANYDILNAVANVEDVKSDPPNVYVLREVITPPEGYYGKTDSRYSD
jgi:hypothetical protein